MWQGFLNRIKAHILPYDILTAVFIILLLGITSFFHSQLPRANHLASIYISLFIALIFFSMMPRDLYDKKAFVHLFYPVFLIPIIFESLGELIPYVNPHFIDATLFKMDTFLCGNTPCLLLQKWIHPWLTEVLQLAYTSYYFMPLILGTVFFIKKDKRLSSFIFAILLGFYLSYIGYLLFPALGPRFWLDPTHSVYKNTYLAKWLAYCLNVLEKNKTDAFPSGHTQISLMCTYFASYLGKGWLFLFGISTTLLIISTIYCRYHHVTDVIAGIALALICLKIAPPLEKHIWRWIKS
ncbi:MAG: phosphatase PAP2 family protein [Candidatus Desulfofervidaceae bacterium]|nr:phosphatase PAP2 family protein [Candidatus Desulfofervidaceae bacterium]